MMKVSIKQIGQLATSLAVFFFNYSLSSLLELFMSFVQKLAMIFFPIN